VNERDDHPGRQPHIKVEAAWRSGPRSPAWDALWRQIRADLGDAFDSESIDNEPESDSQPVSPASDTDEAGP
jgi:hypothetical protein